MDFTGARVQEVLRLAEFSIERNAARFILKNSLQSIIVWRLCTLRERTSGVSMLWVAEALTPARLSQRIPREDNFHEEPRVKASIVRLCWIIVVRTYDRGHMAPNADMTNLDTEFDSFSLVIWC